MQFFLFNSSSKVRVASFKIRCTPLWDGRHPKRRPQHWLPRLDTVVVMDNKEHMDLVTGELQSHSKSLGAQELA